MCPERQKGSQVETGGRIVTPNFRVTLLFLEAGFLFEFLYFT